MPDHRHRGRRSSAELSIIAPDVELQPPKPPADLPQREKALWREIVAAFRPSWFRTCSHLLRVYVASLARLERVEAQLREVEDAGDPRYLSLAGIVHAEAKVVMALGRALRISPQQIRDHRVLKLASTTPAPRPWETGEPDGAA